VYFVVSVFVCVFKRRFAKGDAVSVLDGNNQWSGYFDQRSEVTIETEDGFVMTFLSMN
jgi:hypothetical protein